MEPVPVDRTFLELGGFPHYERVISNFLAFFLDPNAEHKMGSMVLRAIQNLLDIPETLSDVLVETESANIDILVSSASHVIAIENKIYHHADANPFASYVETVRARFRGQSSHFIVLTPFPAVTHGRREELVVLGYVTITYGALFAEIRAIMGGYAGGASNRHWLLLLDFIKTIENISMGSNFDRASLDFFENNATTLSDLLQKIAAFRAELRAKVSALHDLLKAEHPRLLNDERLAGRGALFRENKVFYTSSHCPCPLIQQYETHRIRMQKAHLRNGFFASSARHLLGSPEASRQASLDRGEQMPWMGDHSSR